MNRAPCPLCGGEGFIQVPCSAESRDPPHYVECLCREVQAEVRRQYADVTMPLGTPLKDYK